MILQPIVFMLEIALALVISSALSWFSVQKFENTVFPEPSEVARTIASMTIVCACLAIAAACVVPRIPIFVS